MADEILARIQTLEQAVGDLVRKMDEWRGGAAPDLVDFLGHPRTVAEIADVTRRDPAATWRELQPLARNGAVEKVHIPCYVRAIGDATAEGGLLDRVRQVLILAGPMAREDLILATGAREKRVDDCVTRLKRRGVVESVTEHGRKYGAYAYRSEDKED